MHLRNVILAILVVATVALAQVTLDSPYQVRYATNFSQGQSAVNIIYGGALGNVNQFGPGFGAQTNICVNIYVMDPAEEEVACCACSLTPDQIQAVPLSDTATANGLLHKLLTPGSPTSVVIKLIGSNQTKCDPTAVKTANVTGGYVAFGTTMHLAGTGVYQLTETPFLPVTLSTADPGSELTSLTTRCSGIVGNGSGYGTCPGCTVAGALGAAKGK